MTNEVIAKYVEAGHLAKNRIKIDFKQRNSFVGIFLQERDYEELKAKNFWRIVTQNNVEEWKKSKDVALAKIFNGAEMTRLTAAK
jgi:hypothetical protein